MCYRHTSGMQGWLCVLGPSQTDSPLKIGIFGVPALLAMGVCKGTTRQILSLQGGVKSWKPHPALRGGGQGGGGGGEAFYDKEPGVNTVLELFPWVRSGSSGKKGGLVLASYRSQSLRSHWQTETGRLHLYFLLQQPKI